jgi:hypothetical protein
MMTAMVMMTAIRLIVEIDQTTARAEMWRKEKVAHLPGRQAAVPSRQFR